MPRWKQHVLVAVVLTGIIAGLGAPVTVSADVRYGWDGNTYITNDNRQFLLTIGGRLFADMSVVSADRAMRSEIAGVEDGAELRSARLYSTVSFHDVVEGMLDVGFGDGDVEVKKVFVTLLRVPLADWIRVGFQKEAFGLEKQASLKRIPLMERSLIHALVPMRTNGVNVHKKLWGGRAAVTTGVFRGTGDADGYKSDEVHFTTRVVAVPVHDEDTGRLAHVGASLSVRRAGYDDEDGMRTFQFSSGPENHLLPDLVDTGAFEAASALHVGGEFAAVSGPWSIQSEVAVVSTAAAEAGDPTFRAFYVLGSYVLTGEHRVYKSGKLDGLWPGNRRRGTGETAVRSAAGTAGGKGAWEVALRFSTIDLTDGNIAGGVQNDITAGINWYLSRYVRLMFNYIHANVDDVGTAHQFLTRFQIEF